MIASLVDLVASSSAAGSLSVQAGFGGHLLSRPGENEASFDFAGLLAAALPEAGITMPQPDAQPAAAEPDEAEPVVSQLSAPAPSPRRGTVSAADHVRLPGTILPEGGTNLPALMLAPRPDARPGAAALPAASAMTGPIMVEPDGSNIAPLANPAEQVAQPVLSPIAVALPATSQASGAITAEPDESDNAPRSEPAGLAPQPDVRPIAAALPAPGQVTGAITTEPNASDIVPLAETAAPALLPLAHAFSARAPTPALADDDGEAARRLPPDMPQPGASPALSALRSLPAPVREDLRQNAALALPAGSASDALPPPATAEPAKGAGEAVHPPAPVSPSALAALPTAPVMTQPVQPHAPAQLAAVPEPRSPATRQESAIAQVGEIREALHSVRPAMTLLHAEFGLVSLRLEATAPAPRDWRAVLASRDPEFVPAVQAALAERALAARIDTANSGTGSGSGTGVPSGGHLGAGSSYEQRYGISQGGGQGSFSPYPGHSGQRDEGALPHQRHLQHGRTDEHAGPAAGARDSEAIDPHRRGLFA